MEKALRKKLKNGGFHNVTPKRSRIMSAVRGKGNRTTEVRFRLVLVRASLRGWTLRPPHIVGGPDFYFPAEKVAVFVDGCFWHGCPECGHTPKTNRAFWHAKLQRNKQRDQETTCKLRSGGIRVLRIWEHELERDGEGCLQRLRSLLVRSRFTERRRQGEGVAGCK